MARKRRNSGRSAPSSRAESPLAAPLRIIGGKHRGRKLHYSGDPRTRPMKDRVREAAFNLVGPSVVGKHALDLFAGTGALGLEALSRGAARATLIERHVPTARIIRQNLELLGLQQQAEVIVADAFGWVRRLPDLGPQSWVVFCSPPYDFYVSRSEDMLELVGTLCQRAPAESVLVVEADERFDFQLLPDASQWDVRAYPPAVIGIRRLPAA